ncbi:MAG: SprT family zinc-dependent metalloprotease [Clostridia bacterium]
MSSASSYFLKSYDLTRSDRRSICIAVTADGRLIVRAPKNAPQAAIDRFVAQKADWIAATQAEALNRKAACFVHLFADGEPFQFMGSRYTLHYAQIDAICAAHGELLIPHCAQPRMALLKWYKARAYEEFSLRAAQLSKLMELHDIPPVKLSCAKKRWGSCSHNGININWRLIMAPPQVLEYVLVHELAHVRYPDHQPHFWRFVASILPDYHERRDWLKTHGHELLNCMDE